MRCRARPHASAGLPHLDCPWAGHHFPFRSLLPSHSGWLSPATQTDQSHARLILGRLKKVLWMRHRDMSWCISEPWLKALQPPNTKKIRTLGISWLGVGGEGWLHDSYCCQWRKKNSILFVLVVVLEPLLMMTSILILGTVFMIVQCWSNVESCFAFFLYLFNVKLMVKYLFSLFPSDRPSVLL